MRNSTIGKRSSSMVAIAAVVLSMALSAAPASAAGHGQGQGQSQGQGQGQNNGKNPGQGKGNKHRFVLGISWFHQALGSVGSAIKHATSAEDK